MSNVNTKRKSSMAYLNTVVAPQRLSIANIDNYFNIHGSKLDPKEISEFKLVFGKVDSIDKAIRYAIDESMLPTQLVGKEINKPKKSLKHGHRYVPNFWAYVAYVVIEKITQNSSLVEEILEDKIVINVTSDTVDSFKGPIKTIVPMSEEKMYTGVVRYIIDTICRVGNEDKETLSEALTKALIELKREKDKSVFAGMPFTAEYM